MLYVRDFFEYDYDWKGGPLRRSLSLVAFPLSIAAALPVTFSIPVVTVDLDTQNLLSCESPERLGVVPSISGV